jgi:hypothetical protein
MGRALLIQLKECKNIVEAAIVSRPMLRLAKLN